MSDWIDLTLKGVSTEECLPIFEKTLQAIQNRILHTLSDVTLTAIFDRAVHAGAQNHPLLRGLKIEPSKISLDGALLDPKNRKEAIEALRFFLTEVFTILENLTAGILTKPLYRELSQVAAEIPSQSRNDQEEACKKNI